MITADQIMEHDPCPTNYPRSRIEELIGEGKTALEILDLDIPAVDRIWVLTCKGLLSEHIQRLFAAACAEGALLRERDLGREPDPRSWGAIRAVKLYAEGNCSLADLVAARDAASAAAWGAAWDVAWGVAWGAVYDATWDAAREAARDAAGYAARYIAWETAWDAARATQIEILRGLIGPPASGPS